MSIFLNLPAVRMKAENDKCISCKRCNLECPMSLDVNYMVMHDKMDNSECILCAKCADGCPKKAIELYFGRKSVEVAAILKK